MRVLPINTGPPNPPNPMIGAAWSAFQSALLVAGCRLPVGGCRLARLRRLSGPRVLWAASSSCWVAVKTAYLDWQARVLFRA